MNTTDLPEHRKTHVKIVRPVILDRPRKQHTDRFHKISSAIANRLGSPYAFIGAIALVLSWAITGPIFDFSEGWQLFINTLTTIVTFLMVFAIQNTQNRDAKAMQLKLDELISSSTSARAEFVDIEDLTDVELEELHVQFKDIHAKIKTRIDK